MRLGTPPPARSAGARRDLEAADGALDRLAVVDLHLDVHHREGRGRSLLVPPAPVTFAHGATPPPPPPPPPLPLRPRPGTRAAAPERAAALLLAQPRARAAPFACIGQGRCLGAGYRCIHRLGWYRTGGRGREHRRARGEGSRDGKERVSAHRHLRGHSRVSEASQRHTHVPGGGVCINRKWNVMHRGRQRVGPGRSRGHARPKQPVPRLTVPCHTQHSHDGRPLLAAAAGRRSNTLVRQQNCQCSGVRATESVPSAPPVSLGLTGCSHEPSVPLRTDIRRRTLAARKTRIVCHKLRAAHPPAAQRVVAMEQGIPPCTRPPPLREGGALLPSRDSNPVVKGTV